MRTDDETRATLKRIEELTEAQKQSLICWLAGFDPETFERAMAHIQRTFPQQA